MPSLARKVLLLEAGQHFKTVDSFPKELKYTGILSSMAPDHPNNWAFAATLRPGVEQIVPRGKVVGGSSALNGTLFTRALPEDFNGWAAAGNDEWSFDKVLPYLRKLETDLGNLIFAWCRKPAWDAMIARIFYHITGRVMHPARPFQRSRHLRSRRR